MKVASGILAGGVGARELLELISRSEGSRKESNYRLRSILYTPIGDLKVMRKSENR